jgi:hypothetical protein
MAFHAAAFQAIWLIALLGAEIMSNFIYIAGSFETVNRSKCGRGKAWIDNDPHFWSDPPTWGICRNDLRQKTYPGNYIFFVLPKNGKHPQMIFGYMKVEEKISHIDAYHHPQLVLKRMGNKNPNGNIIVDSHGKYNLFDGSAHKNIFDKIKKEYAIGKQETSKFLTANEIKSLAPNFVAKLSQITRKEGNRPIDIISRYGLELSNSQVQQLIAWIGT